MKPAVKKLWLKALRSGEYRQGKRRLRSSFDNSFCCLGVLCNLHAQAHPKIAARQKDAERYCGEVSFLPHEVQEWAGLGESDPCIMNRRLSIHNDGINEEGRLPKNFLQIADLIEEYL